MATGPGFPAVNAVYPPNFDASGRLIVGFSRNAKRFTLPRYVQYVPVEQTRGYYLKLTAQEAARVVNVQDYIWPDGHNRPMGDGLESFNFLEFTTIRYAYNFTLGSLTANQAVWDIVEQHSQIKAAKCMTARTIRMLALLTTAANWQTSADPDISSNHTDTATNIGGGKWDVSTSSNLYIKKSLDAIAELITKDTLGVIGDQPDSTFNVVMNPNMARLTAESDEVHNFIKGSPDAMAEIKSGQSPNARYGLPSTLYGYNVIVEKAVKVTSRKGDTLARSFCVPNNTVLVTSVVGGLEGVYGAPSFSTASLFALEEMSLERRDDTWNRLTEGSVVENTAEALTCPASGYMLSSAAN